MTWFALLLYFLRILRVYLSKMNELELGSVKPFPTVHGVLKARMLKWFAIPFSSGPHFVRTLHQDLTDLGGPTRYGS